MSLEQQQREEILDSANDTVRRLYSDPLSGKFLWELFCSTNPGEPNYSQYTQFAVAVGDIILGIHKKETLPQLLSYKIKGATETQINNLVKGLAPFLAQIPDQSSIDTQSPEDASNPKNTTSTPAQLTAVKPMRTYSDDVNMSRAHSYGAFRPQGEDDEDEPTHNTSQNDLLDRR